MQITRSGLLDPQLPVTYAASAAYANRFATLTRKREAAEAYVPHLPYNRYCTRKRFSLREKRLCA